MTEEFITLSIIKWLESNNWEIVCFDFPQSGTGKLLKSKNFNSEKNKGVIIPDIVAVRDNKVVFFENKDRFYFDDFKKINILRTTDLYKKSIENLLKKYSYFKIYYGMGVPNKENIKDKLNQNSDLTDFILLVNNKKAVEYFYNPLKINFN